MDQCARMPAPDQSADSWAGWLEAQGNVFFLYARQHTRTESDAKDVLQDALTEAWRVEGGKIPGKGLVFTIIRRRAIDLGRSIDRRSRREMDFVGNNSGWFVPDYTAADTGESLAAAIQELPDKLREVLVLRIWGELSFPEIAKVAEIPQATATSRYRYALERLRECETLNELKT